MPGQRSGSRVPRRGLLVGVRGISVGSSLQGTFLSKSPKTNLTLYNLLGVTGNFTSHDLVQHSRHDQAHGGARSINHGILLGHSKDSFVTMLKCGLVSSGYGVGLKVQAYVLLCTCMCMCTCIQGVHEVREQLLGNGSLLPCR